MTWDVVYIYKKKNEDTLRYSLRSLVNIPHGKVFVVGDIPSWVQNVIHIPYIFGKGRVLDAWTQIKLACEDERVSEEFIFMNDDFYIMHPIDNIPYYIRNHGKKNARSIHGKALDRTRILFKDFKCYDSVHTPMIFSKKMFLDLYNHYDISKQYVYKTLYGNHYRIPATEHHDVKTRSITAFLKRFNRGTPFMSTSDNVERDKRFKDLMDTKFNPCEYENIYEPIRGSGQHVLPVAMVERKPQRKHPRAPLPISSKKIKRRKARLR